MTKEKKAKKKNFIELNMIHSENSKQFLKTNVEWLQMTDDKESKCSSICLENIITVSKQELFICFP